MSLMTTPHFVQVRQTAGPALAQEASQGLLQVPAQVAPKFFYDALGSRLFDAITELEVYYPTRTEAAIFASQGAAMAQALRACVGEAPVLIDVGAGNCAKAARLFPLLTPSVYVALDISVDFLRHCLQALQREHPGMAMVGVGLDFSAGLTLPPNLPGLDAKPRVLFYPGSSIGNFAPEPALQLLRDMRAAAAGGALLIGVDLVKSPVLLQAAYDDALGVTAAFNLNVLLHLNRVLGSDFRVSDWRHVALFNSAASRIEMHLEAHQALTVHWPGNERRFAAGERIHTENSYKWSVPDFAALLQDAGFGRVQHWQDDKAWFGVFLASD